MVYSEMYITHVKNLDLDLDLDSDSLKFVYYYLLAILLGVSCALCIPREHDYTLIPSIDIDNDDDVEIFPTNSFCITNVNDETDNINNEYF